MRRNRYYSDGPELPVENDPEFKREMFETFKELGCLPDELQDGDTAQEYAEWLNQGTPIKPSL